MNNRKTKNKRGKNPRQYFAQVIEEKPTKIVKGKEVPNPDFPGKRRIIQMTHPPVWKP